MRGPHTIAFIVTEHDIDDPFRSHGAIIMEQYTKNDSEAVLERAQMFADGGKYGRVWYGHISADLLVPVLPANPIKEQAG